MTTISSPVKSYRVLIRDGDTTVGYTESTTLLDNAQATLTRMRLAYPKSLLEALIDDGDLGSWRQVTEEDLETIRDIGAVVALARLLDEGLPRIDWTLSDLSRGTLSGYTHSRAAFEKYVHLLRAESTVAGGGKDYTNLKVNGVYEGVSVQVNCHARNARPAEVSA